MSPRMAMSRGVRHGHSPPPVKVERMASMPTRRAPGVGSGSGGSVVLVNPAAGRPAASVPGLSSPRGQCHAGRPGAQLSSQASSSRIGMGAHPQPLPNRQPHLVDPAHRSQLQVQQQRQTRLHPSQAQQRGSSPRAAALDRHPATSQVAQQAPLGSWNRSRSADAVGPAAPASASAPSRAPLYPNLRQPGLGGSYVAGPVSSRSALRDGSPPPKDVLSASGSRFAVPPPSSMASRPDDMLSRTFASGISAVLPGHSQDMPSHGTSGRHASPHLQAKAASQAIQNAIQGMSIALAAVPRSMGSPVPNSARGCGASSCQVPVQQVELQQPQRQKSGSIPSAAVAPAPQTLLACNKADPALALAPQGGQMQLLPEALALPALLESPRDHRRAARSSASGDSVTSPYQQMVHTQDLILDSSEGDVSNVEGELLKRIAAIEAQVVDRNGLLAQISRQQEQLDRLETLAKENAALRAQVARRSDARRPPAKEPSSGPSPATQRSRARPGNGMQAPSNLTRRLGQVPGATNQVQGHRGSPNLDSSSRESPPPTLTPRQLVSSPLSPTAVKSSQQSVPQLKLSSAQEVSRSASQDLLRPRSHMQEDEATSPTASPRGSVPQMPTIFSAKQSMPKKDQQDLECRLGELEMALGLTLGAEEVAEQVEPSSKESQLLDAPPGEPEALPE
eukprot:TRINITY_DN16493_c0_g1_i2.p1 TRINITY_DN16493_c0_g1~~TRINITY_DN16493_c0_g1_i2.p1  ORF type:complete len:719 (+),score=138.85 TRINITY_DN16493_c0_g1_i2:124-2157(+)